MSRAPMLFKGFDKIPSNPLKSIDFFKVVPVRPVRPGGPRSAYVGIHPQETVSLIGVTSRGY